MFSDGCWWLGSRTACRDSCFCNSTDNGITIGEEFKQALGVVFADGAYAGAKLEEALAALGRWRIEIVRRSDAAQGFELLTRRWVVERTIAWVNRNRRLAKDFEALIASATAWLMLASVKLLMRRLARQ